MNVKYRPWYIPIALLFIACVPLVAFFHPGLPHGHDAQDHVVRIANFYASLTEGIVVPRWAENLNWGYGHPVMMFLYPFPSYMASLFHFLGFSFVNATKAVFVVSYIASIMAMYLFMQAAWGKRAGVIGGLLYGFAPYRFVDMYVRMAIGEHVAFIFPPLICYFLYKFAHTRRIGYGIGIAFSLALLMLSHNAFTLMFLPIVTLYGLYVFFYDAKKSWQFAAWSIFYALLGFGLSSFFWIPAFFEGKYTLRDIVTAGEALKRFVPFSWFFYSPWNYGGGETMTKEVGILQWLGIVTSLYIYGKLKESKEKVLLWGLWILFVLFLFIMTPASSYIWERIMILQNFQFPLRFLGPVVFISAVLGGFSFATLLRIIQRNRKVGRRYYFLFSLLCILIVGVTFHMWHPKGYQIEDQSFYTRIYPGTTDTGESSPIWSIRFMEHTPANPIEVIDGEAIMTPLVRRSTVHEYKVVAAKQTRMVENTLFFPGWKIYIDDIGAGIQFQDERYRGLMTFWIDQGEHTVRVVFTDTKVRKTATIISMVSISIIVVMGIARLLWKKST